MEWKVAEIVRTKLTLRRRGYKVSPNKKKAAPKDKTLR